MRVVVTGGLAHTSQHSCGDLGGGVEWRQVEVFLLAEVHRDQRVQAVEQFLERADVAGVGGVQTLDPSDDRLVQNTATPDGTPNLRPSAGRPTRGGT